MVNIKIATGLLVYTLLLQKALATTHDITSQRNLNEINGQDENRNEPSNKSNKNNNTRTLRTRRSLQGKGGGYYNNYGSSHDYYHHDYYYQQGKGKGKGGYYNPPPPPVNQLPIIPCFGSNCGPDYTYPTPVPYVPISTTCQDGSIGPIDPDTCINVCPDDGSLSPGCVQACPDDGPRPDSVFCARICEVGTNNVPVGCREKCCDDSDPVPTAAPQDPIATTCPDGSTGPVYPDTCVDICDDTGFLVPGCRPACEGTSSDSDDCVSVCILGSASVPAGCQEACCKRDVCPDGENMAPLDPDNCVIACGNGINDECVIPCPTDGTAKPFYCSDICTGNKSVDEDDCLDLCCPELPEPTSAPTAAPQERITTTCPDGSIGPFDPDTCVDVCPTDGSRPFPGCVDACPTDGSDFAGFCIDICETGSDSVPAGCREACCSKEACPLDPDMVAPPVPDDCVLECPDDGSFFDGCVVPCPTDPDAFRPTGCVDICTGSRDDVDGCEYICCRESAAPSIAPTEAPSPSPSSQPSEAPSPSPSAAPSPEPSMVPTMVHSTVPSLEPTNSPSAVPTLMHSNVPSLRPSAGPSPQPSAMPSPAPSVMPSLGPSPQPSIVPTPAPSGMPSAGPSPSPSEGPSPSPSEGPSPIPSFRPSPSPTLNPTGFPTGQPQEPIRDTCPDGDMVAPEYPTLCVYECPATGVRPSDCVVFCDENPTDPDCLPVCDANIRITEILAGNCAERCCGEPEPVPVPTETPTAMPNAQIRPTCPDGDMVAPIFPRFCADECPTTGQRPTGCVVFCDVNPSDPSCLPVCDEDVVLSEVLQGSCAERCCDVPTPAPSCPPIGGGLRPALGLPEGCEFPTAAPQVNIIGPPAPTTISKPLPPYNNNPYYGGKGKGKGKGGGYYYYGYRD